MLDKLFGSINKERVLVYLAARGRGYAREIARFFKSPLSPVQNALDSLEAAGVVVSRMVGRTCEYEFNPRYPARAELAALIDRALSLYPPKLRNVLLVARSRPRRRSKPLAPSHDGALTSELLQSNPAFQALVAKSKASPRKPFPQPRRS